MSDEKEPAQVYDEDCQFLQNVGPQLERATDLLNRHHRNDNPVDRAAGFFVSRLNQTFSVLAYLRLNYTGPFEHEACVLLRSMYDVCLQLLYLLHDNTKASERAEDFEAFRELERDKHLRSCESHASIPFFRKLVNSPLRSQNEPELRKRIAAAKKRFDNAKHKNWYKTDLKQVARAVGYPEEYDGLIASLNHSVHASPSAKGGAVVREEHLLVYGWTLCFRAIGRLMEYKAIRPDKDLAESLDAAKKSIF
jgi:hypothetical protein